MGDISAFPTIRNVFAGGKYNTITMTATTALKAGMVVEIDATGVDLAVNAAVKEAGASPVGVALYDAAAGSKVDILTVGGIAYVANADDTTGTDAGDALITNDNTVGGTVSASLAVGTVSTQQKIIGIALDDIAGGGTGRVLITLGHITAHG